MQAGRRTWGVRVMACFLVMTLGISPVVPAGTPSALPPNLPAPGTLVGPSAAFSPLVLRGVTVYPENPLRFDFIIDGGEGKRDAASMESAGAQLIRYFLTSLTIPDDDLWVNLSPDEDDRIIPAAFGRTEMGRDLLAQDYMLKQLTASLTYPEEALGQRFWQTLFQRSYTRYGTTDIPVNTFHKVWVMPQKAVVYERGTTAFIVESRLKVLLESDYLALAQRTPGARGRSEDVSGAQTAAQQDISSAVMRDIILPAIEQEINEGEHFATLRKIYHALILGAWYKKRLREAVLGRLYVDRHKIKGVESDDAAVSKRIYEQYLQAFQKGVFDYVKEDYDPYDRRLVPRKYFSGGKVFTAMSENLEIIDTPREVSSALIGSGRKRSRLPVVLEPVSSSALSLLPQRRVRQFLQEIGDLESAYDTELLRLRVPAPVATDVLRIKASLEERFRQLEHRINALQRHKAITANGMLDRVFTAYRAEIAHRHHDIMDRLVLYLDLTLEQDRPSGFVSEAQEVRERRQRTPPNDFWEEGLRLGSREEIDMTDRRQRADKIYKDTLRLVGFVVKRGGRLSRVFKALLYTRALMAEIRAQQKNGSEFDAIMKEIIGGVELPSSEEEWLAEADKLEEKMRVQILSLLSGYAIVSPSDSPEAVAKLKRRYEHRLQRLVTQGAGADIRRLMRRESVKQWAPIAALAVALGIGGAMLQDEAVELWRNVVGNEAAGTAGTLPVAVVENPGPPAAGTAAETAEAERVPVFMDDLLTPGYNSPGSLRPVSTDRAGDGAAGESETIRQLRSEMAALRQQAVVVAREKAAIEQKIDQARPAAEQKAQQLQERAEQLAPQTSGPAADQEDPQEWVTAESLAGTATESEVSEESGGADLDHLISEDLAELGDGNPQLDERNQGLFARVNIRDGQAALYLQEGYYPRINPVSGMKMPVSPRWQLWSSEAASEKANEWITMPTQGRMMRLLVPPGYVVAGIQTSQPARANVYYDRANGAWAVKFAKHHSGRMRIMVRKARDGELPDVAETQWVDRDGNNLDAAAGREYVESLLPPTVVSILRQAADLPRPDQEAVIERISHLFTYTTNPLLEKMAQQEGYINLVYTLFAAECEWASIARVMKYALLDIPSQIVGGFRDNESDRIFPLGIGHAWVKTADGIKEPTQYFGQLSPLWQKADVTRADWAAEIEYLKAAAPFQEAQLEAILADLKGLLLDKALAEKQAELEKAASPDEAPRRLDGQIRERYAAALAANEQRRQQWQDYLAQSLSTPAVEQLLDEIERFDPGTMDDEYQLMSQGHLLLGLLDTTADQLAQPAGTEHLTDHGRAFIAGRINDLKTDIYQRMMAAADVKGWELIEPIPPPEIIRREWGWSHKSELSPWIAQPGGVIDALTGTELSFADAENNLSSGFSISDYFGRHVVVTTSSGTGGRMYSHSMSDGSQINQIQVFDKFYFYDHPFVGNDWLGYYPEVTTISSAGPATPVTRFTGPVAERGGVTDQEGVFETDPRKVEWRIQVIDGKTVFRLDDLNRVGRIYLKGDWVADKPALQGKVFSRISQVYHDPDDPAGWFVYFKTPDQQDDHVQIAGTGRIYESIAQSLRQIEEQWGGRQNLFSIDINGVISSYNDDLFKVEYIGPDGKGRARFVGTLVGGEFIEDFDPGNIRLHYIDSGKLLAIVKKDGLWRFSGQVAQDLVPAGYTSLAEVVSAEKPQEFTIFPNDEFVVYVPGTGWIGSPGQLAALGLSAPTAEQEIRILTPSVSPDGSLWITTMRFGPFDGETGIALIVQDSNGNVIERRTFDREEDYDAPWKELQWAGNMFYIILKNPNPETILQFYIVEGPWARGPGRLAGHDLSFSMIGGLKVFFEKGQDGHPDPQRFVILNAISWARGLGEIRLSPQLSGRLRSMLPSGEVAKIFRPEYLMDGNVLFRFQRTQDSEEERVFLRPLAAQDFRVRAETLYDVLTPESRIPAARIDLRWERLEGSIDGLVADRDQRLQEQEVLSRTDRHLIDGSLAALSGDVFVQDSNEAGQTEDVIDVEQVKEEFWALVTDMNANVSGRHYDSARVHAVLERIVADLREVLLAPVSDVLALFRMLDTYGLGEVKPSLAIAILGKDLTAYTGEMDLRELWMIERHVETSFQEYVTFLAGHHATPVTTILSPEAYAPQHRASVNALRQLVEDEMSGQAAALERFHAYQNDVADAYTLARVLRINTRSGDGNYEQFVYANFADTFRWLHEQVGDTIPFRSELSPDARMQPEYALIRALRGYSSWVKFGADYQERYRRWQHVDQRLSKILEEDFAGRQKTERLWADLLGEWMHDPTFALFVLYLAGLAAKGRRAEKRDRIADFTAAGAVRWILNEHPWLDGRAMTSRDAFRLMDAMRATTAIETRLDRIIQEQLQPVLHKDGELFRDALINALRLLPLEPAVKTQNFWVRHSWVQYVVPFLWATISRDYRTYDRRQKVLSEAIGYVRSFDYPRGSPFQFQQGFKERFGSVREEEFAGSAGNQETEKILQQLEQKGFIHRDRQRQRVYPQSSYHEEKDGARQLFSELTDNQQRQLDRVMRQPYLVIDRIEDDPAFSAPLVNRQTLAKKLKDAVKNPEQVRGVDQERQASGQGGAFWQQRSTGGEFSGHREYQPGDSSRHIDWRKSAKTAKLQVKQFEYTNDVANGIVIDFRILDEDRLDEWAAHLVNSIKVLFASQRSDVAFAQRAQLSQLLFIRPDGRVVRKSVAFETGFLSYDGMVGFVIQQVISHYHDSLQGKIARDDVWGSNLYEPASWAEIRLQARATALTDAFGDTRQGPGDLRQQLSVPLKNVSDLNLYTVGMSDEDRRRVKKNFPAVRVLYWDGSVARETQASSAIGINEQASTAPGGMDLTTRHMPLDVRKSEAGNALLRQFEQYAPWVQMDLAPGMEMEGFRPVFINSPQPMPNALLFDLLGLSPDTPGLETTAAYLAGQ